MNQNAFRKIFRFGFISIFFLVPVLIHAIVHRNYRILAALALYAIFMRICVWYYKDAIKRYPCSDVMEERKKEWLPYLLCYWKAQAKANKKPTKKTTPFVFIVIFLLLLAYFYSTCNVHGFIEFLQVVFACGLFTILIYCISTGFYTYHASTNYDSEYRSALVKGFIESLPLSLRYVDRGEMLNDKVRKMFLKSFGSVYRVPLTGEMLEYKMIKNIMPLKENGALSGLGKRDDRIASLNVIDAIESNMFHCYFFQYLYVAVSHRRQEDFSYCMIAEVNGWNPSVRISNHKENMNELGENELKSISITNQFSLYFPKEIDINQVVTSQMQECLKKYLEEYEFHFDIIFEDKIYIHPRGMEFFKNSKIEHGKNDTMSIYQFFCLTKMIEELSQMMK